jgi:hypothetical protein
MGLPGTLRPTTAGVTFEHLEHYDIQQPFSSAGSEYYSLCSTDLQWQQEWRHEKVCWMEGIL